MASPQSITLDMQKCDDFLVKYLETGYKNAKIFSIKEGAQIAKYCRLISGDEKDESVKRESIYATIFQVLEGMNKTGAFSLGDATLLEKIMNVVTEKYTSEKKEKISKKEEDDNEPKIREV